MRDDHEDEMHQLLAGYRLEVYRQCTEEYREISSVRLLVDVLGQPDGNEPYKFYNKLGALTDQAPGDYIRLIRLKRSVKLLKGTHSITEIQQK